MQISSYTNRWWLMAILLGGVGVPKIANAQEIAYASVVSNALSPAGYNFNPSGQAITVTHPGTGQYGIQFNGTNFFGLFSIPLVTSTASTVRRCKIFNWSSDTINVNCFDSSGASQDSDLSVTVYPSGNDKGIAAAWAFSSSSASYTPGATSSFNPGGAITLTRSGTGHYAASFAGLSGNAGDVQVTAYGTGGNLCQVVSWGGTPFSASINCYDSNGISADSQYNVVVVPTGVAPRALGFAWADQQSIAGPYVPDPGHSFSSVSNPISISSPLIGVYQVTFKGLDVSRIQGGNAMVSAYGTSFASCQEASNPVFTNTDLTITVKCYNTTGNLTDSRFTVLVIPPEIVRNGGFELPVGTGTGNAAVISAAAFAASGWTTSATTAEIQRNFGTTTPDGNQWVELDGNSNTSIYQDLTTTPGRIYRTTFLFANRGGSPSSQVRANFGSQQFTSPSVTSTAWVSYTFDAVATAATTRLQFDGIGPSDGVGDLLDAVSVTLLDTLPVSVSVGKNIGGPSFSVDGNLYTTNQPFSWIPGSSHTIATTSPQTPAKGIHFVWTSWSDGGAISHTVAPTSNTTYTANFKFQYQLTLAPSPAAGGSVAPASGTYYDDGTVVPITATANTGFGFTNWEGGADNPTKAATTVTMLGPFDLAAVFAVVPCSFQLSSSSVFLPATGTSTNGFYPSVPHSFTLTPSAGCNGVAWTATAVDTGGPGASTPSSFINITAGASGSGTTATSISFNAFANTHLSTRTATITITASGITPVVFNISETGSAQSLLNREVQALYQRGLGREPDTGGFNFWTCTTPAPGVGCANLGLAGLGQMVDLFLSSAEGQNTDLQALAIYQAILGRYPTFAEWTAAVAGLRTNPQNTVPAATALVSSLVNLPEYASHFGPVTNTSLVTNLYNNVLGRGPNQTELANGTGALTVSGTGAMYLLFNSIFTGAEFQNTGIYNSGPDHTNGMFIRMMYLVILSRESEPGGFGFWLGVANGGGPGIYYNSASLRLLIEGPGTPNVGFVGSPEFQGLFAN